MEGEGLGPRDETTEVLDDPVDLPGAGDEDEGVAPFVVVGRRRPRDVLEEVAGHAPMVRAGPRVRSPSDAQRVEGAGAVDERSRPGIVGEDLGDGLGIKGGGHRNEGELAELAHLGEHADEQVGVEGALVDLVEDHGGGAGELGVGEQTTDEHPRGNELDPRRAAHVALPADRVSHEITDRRPGEVGEAGGRGAHGDPARAGHDDPTGDALRDERGREGRLAGPGRSLDDRQSTIGDGGTQLLQGLGEGEALADRRQVEPAHARSRVKSCVVVS